MNTSNHGTATVQRRRVKRMLRSAEYQVLRERAELAQRENEWLRREVRKLVKLTGEGLEAAVGSLIAELGKDVS